MSAAVAFVLGLLLMPVLVGLLMGWLYLRETERTTAKRLSGFVGGRRLWATIHAESAALAAEAVVALMERESA